APHCRASSSSASRRWPLPRTSLSSRLFSRRPSVAPSQSSLGLSCYFSARQKTRATWPTPPLNSPQLDDCAPTRTPLRGRYRLAADGSSVESDDDLRCPAVPRKNCARTVQEG